MTAPIAGRGLEKSTMRAVTWRILPLVFLLYFGASIDRTSLGYAQLKMGKELGIDPAVFGLAASMFYVGYTLCEVPSNTFLYRFGSRIWLARIGISWGIITVLTGFVQNETQLMIARVLLGIAEAGLAPGVLFYIMTFFPAAYKSRASSLFFMGGPLASVLAGPLAGVVLDHVRWADLSSWRWIFILFGLPALVFGILIAILLSNTVEKTKWLTAEQKQWLSETIAKEETATKATKTGSHGGGFWKNVANPRALLMSFFQFCIVCGIVGTSYFVPQIVKGIAKAGTSYTVIGLLAGLPFLCAAICQWTVAKSSDRHNERVWHLAIPTLISAATLAILPTIVGQPLIAMIVLCIAVGSLFGFPGPAFSMAQEQFVGRSAAIGLAVVTTGSALSGLVAPYVFGLLTRASGSTGLGEVFLAICVGAGGLTVVLTRKKWTNVNVLQPTKKGVAGQDVGVG